MQLQLHDLITLHHNYNSTTLQLQLQLHYATLHPAVVGEVTDQVTTVTIVTTQKIQLQPPLSPSVDSLCHLWFTTTKLSYRFPILKLPTPPCAVLLVCVLLCLILTFNIRAIWPVLIVFSISVSHHIRQVHDAYSEKERRFTPHPTWQLLTRAGVSC